MCVIIGGIDTPLVPGMWVWRVLDTIRHWVLLPILKGHLHAKGHLGVRGERGRGRSEKEQTYKPLHTTHLSFIKLPLFHVFKEH